MKRRIDYLPVIIMLLAGLITCIFIIVYDYELLDGLIALVAALIVFYIIGKIIRFIAVKKLTISMEAEIESDDQPVSDEED